MTGKTENSEKRPTARRGLVVLVLLIATLVIVVIVALRWRIVLGQYRQGVLLYE